MNKIKRILSYFNLILFGFNNNKDLSFNLLTMLGRRIMPSYRFTYPQMIWWDDTSFNSSLQRFGELDGFNTHRKFALAQLLRLVSNLPGDTAECGVYKGSSSYLILLANKKSKENKTHHIFDSFEGLSEPGTFDGEHWSTGNLSVPEIFVIDMLKPFAVNSDFICYKGWIPSRFNEVKELNFCFIHVDVDLYQPTLDTLEFFYERIVPGGVFLCDDYGFSTCPGVTKCIDEFLSNKTEKMISLPDGGGFFIKGINVD